jgi:hypothetical protein
MGSQTAAATQTSNKQQQGAVDKLDTQQVELEVQQAAATLRSTVEMAIGLQAALVSSSWFESVSLMSQFRAAVGTVSASTVALKQAMERLAGGGGFVDARTPAQQTLVMAFEFLRRVHSGYGFGSGDGYVQGLSSGARKVSHEQALRGERGVGCSGFRENEVCAVPSETGTDTDNRTALRQDAVNAGDLAYKEWEAAIFEARLTARLAGPTKNKYIDVLAEVLGKFVPHGKVIAKSTIVAKSAIDEATAKALQDAKMMGILYEEATAARWTAAVKEAIVHLDDYGTRLATAHLSTLSRGHFKSRLMQVEREVMQVHSIGQYSGQTGRDTEERFEAVWISNGQGKTRLARCTVDQDLVRTGIIEKTREFRYKFIDWIEPRSVASALERHNAQVIDHGVATILPSQLQGDTADGPKQWAADSKMEKP